jgi:hypothetical protein
LFGGIDKRTNHELEHKKNAQAEGAGMRAVEDLIELASIGAFFVMVVVWSGVGTNWPLI